MSLRPDRAAPISGLPSPSMIALGLAPVLTLTTDLIVGSAPPERAGAASGISETAVELGGALGISILGSIGIAIYPTDAQDADALIKTADAAMYSAKQAKK